MWGMPSVAGWVGCSGQPLLLQRLDGKHTGTQAPSRGFSRPLRQAQPAPCRPPTHAPTHSTFSMAATSCSVNLPLSARPLPCTGGGDGWVGAVSGVRGRGEHGGA